jgi:hypothetical protein
MEFMATELKPRDMIVFREIVQANYALGAVRIFETYIFKHPVDRDVPHLSFELFLLR